MRRVLLAVMLVAGCTRDQEHAMHRARNNIARGNPRGVVGGDSGGPFDD